MKLNKKQIGWIAGLACVLVLIVLMLTMCSGYGDHQGEAQAPTQESTEVTAGAEETTEAAEETEETTEATEEATEETTEATEATEETTGGNTTPGGTGGYVPDSGDDDEDSSGTTTEKAPDAGSADSPYVEKIQQLPDQFTTALAPVGSSLFYHVYGAEGAELIIEDAQAIVMYQDKVYTPDQDGVVTVPFAAENSGVATVDETESVEDQVQPQLFWVATLGKEEKSFLVQFRAPLGDPRNPEVLEATEDGILSVEAKLSAGDLDGYYYSYLPESDGTMTLQVSGATEGVCCDVIVTVGETVQKLSETEDGILSVDLTQDEEVLIQVIILPGEDGTIPAAEVQLSGLVECAPGTKGNPIVIFGEFPIVTDEIAPGEQIYYSVYGANGMILSLEDGDALVTVGEDAWNAVDGIITGEIVGGNPREAVLIAIGNAGESQKSFTVNFSHKLGTMQNPDQLLIDQVNTAVIGENASDGYWYSWTAEEEGVLTLTMPEGEWMYVVNNKTTSEYGDTQYSDSDPLVNPAEITVAAGDELSIMVSTYDSGNPFDIPAGELVFEAAFTSTVGTKENPVWLINMETVIKVKPNASVYCNVVMSGVNMTVSGDGAFTVTYNGSNYPAQSGVVTVENVTGKRQSPISMILTNYGSETAEYTVTFTYPLGSSSNPQILEEMGLYTACVKGDGAGYFYSWTAEQDGQFILTMKCDDWTCVVNNLTTGSYGDIHSSAAGDSATQTVEVKAGDLLQINVSTASREDKDVITEFDFVDPNYGTQDNPVWLIAMENTVTVRTDATVYCNVVFGNVNMTVSAARDFTLSLGGETYQSANGVLVVEGVSASRNAPLALILTNSGEEKLEYTIRFENPIGSSMNPQVIGQLTTYVAAVKGDSEGYWYTWTAPGDGLFVLTMKSDDWIYVVNNMTTYRYGEFQNSIYGDPSVYSVEVSSGDVLEINIGTASYESKNVWVEFDYYDPTIGTEDNPIWITDLDTTLTVRPGQALYCVTRHNGADLIITGDVTVTLNGTGYPLVDGTVTIEDVVSTRDNLAKLVFTTSGLTKANCTVKAVYPVGYQQNPLELTEMGTYDLAVHSDGIGYNLLWTAPEDGDFTINMLGDDWIYVTQTQSGDEYLYGNTNYSSADDPASTTLDVKAGDIVTINIGSASGNLIQVSVEFSFQAASETAENLLFEGDYIPKVFQLQDDEIQEMGPIDLTRKYTLHASVAGIYRLEDLDGSLLLLDFTDDTYVNLAKLVQERELYIPVETENGTEYRQCNELLQAYIDNAWVDVISEDEVRTLYPLTEDLELILKSLGEQYGWFDPESDGYLFAAEAEEAQTDSAPALEEETLWMFSCHYVQFVMEETADPESGEISQQASAAEDEESTGDTESEIE